jgi:hypothetical protein
VSIFDKRGRSNMTTNTTLDDVLNEDIKQADVLFVKLTGKQYCWNTLFMRQSVADLVEAQIMSNCLIYSRQVQHHIKEGAL